MALNRFRLKRNRGRLVTALRLLLLCGVAGSFSIAASTADAVDPGLSRADAVKRFGEMQRQREKEGKPLLALVDLVDMFNDKVKRELLRDAANTNAMFPRFKGRWNLIDTPRIALAWALQEQLPLEPQVLMVLGSVMGKATTPKQKFQMACLLYQHKQADGKTYLRTRLADMKDAAFIFAINREKATAEQMKSLLTATTSKDIHALAHWADPAVEQLLVRGATADAPLQGDYLTALCLYPNKLPVASVSKIHAIFGKTKDQIRRISAASALLRHGDGRIKKEMREYIDRRLRGQGPSEWQLIDELVASWAASRADPKGLSSGLRHIVTSYLSSKEPELGDRQYYAIEGLIATQQPANDALVLKAIKKMLASDVPASGIDRLVYWTHLNGGKSLSKQMETHLSAKRVERVKAIAGLNRIPVAWGSSDIPAFTLPLGPLAK
jgi:hypothetical protein